MGDYKNTRDCLRLKNVLIKTKESPLIHGHTTRLGKASDVLSGITIDRFESLPDFGNPQRVEHVDWDIPRQGYCSRDLVRAYNAKRACDNMRTQAYLNSL